MDAFHQRVEAESVITIECPKVLIIYYKQVFVKSQENHQTDGSVMDIA